MMPEHPRRLAHEALPFHVESRELRAISDGRRTLFRRAVGLFPEYPSGVTATMVFILV